MYCPVGFDCFLPCLSLSLSLPSIFPLQYTHKNICDYLGNSKLYGENLLDKNCLIFL